MSVDATVENKAVEPTKSEANSTQSEPRTAIETNSSAENGTKIVTHLGNIDSSPRSEVTASTIARMMGVATSAELKLFEGKLDLISTKVNTITGRLEKVISLLNNAPTGSDLDRIDVQIGSLKTMIRDALSKMGVKAEEEE